MRLQDITIYPIKSFAGIDLTESEVNERGLLYDRNWMLVNKQGKFISQREFKELSLLTTEIDNDKLKITHRFQKNFHVQLGLNESMFATSKVALWDDIMFAENVSEEASQQLSEMLKQEVSLVKIGRNTSRLADSRFVDSEIQVSFADGFPFLIISQASLDDLNSRLESPVEMNRFRPNIVVSGSEPFEEDKWKEIQIGECIFQIVKPCARCEITTINQQTAERGKEPLRTLSKYRRDGNKVLFGQNMVSLKKGKIRIGDEVKILK
ncbi:MOSC domain-containing protein [Peijinzhouia sedimentorum]